MNKRIISIIALITALAMVALLGCACKSEEQLQQEAAEQSASTNVSLTTYTEPVNTITVSGNGSTTAQPDMATIVFEVRTEGETATEAQEQNTLIMEAVLQAVRARGVAEEDITTSYLYLSEQYDWDKTPAEVVGYELYNSIDVTVRDISILGDLISDAVAAGATGTGGVEFCVEDYSVPYAEALTAAMQDARAAAETLATAAGCRLVELPVSISETSYNQPVLYRNTDVAEAEASAAADSGSAASISTGELTVEAAVTVVYSIEPLA